MVFALTSAIWVNFRQCWLFTRRIWKQCKSNKPSMQQRRRTCSNEHRYSRARCECCCCRYFIAYYACTAVDRNHLGFCWNLCCATRNLLLRLLLRLVNRVQKKNLHQRPVLCWVVTRPKRHRRRIQPTTMGTDEYVRL